MRAGHQGPPRSVSRRTPRALPEHVYIWMRPAAVHDFDGDDLPEFAHSSAAQYAVGQLAEALHGCGWHETRSPGDQGHGSTAPLVYEYVLTNGAQAPLRVTLVQSDHRVAVLVLATPQVADHAHTDPRTENCLEETMNSAQPHAPSPSATGHC